MGDIDELLKELEPEAELKTKIDSYRKSVQETHQFQ